MFALPSLAACPGIVRKSHVSWANGLNRSQICHESAHWGGRDLVILNREMQVIMMTAELNIIVVERDPDLAGTIVAALQDACRCDVVVVCDCSDLTRQVVLHAPDFVLIHLNAPTPVQSEEILRASGPLDRPVALFVSDITEGQAQAAIDAGVSAYVVDGMAPDRIKPVMDTAIARFSMMQQMRNELTQTRRALEERIVIDRAKGVLMKAKSIDEGAAYALLRKAAMDQGRRVPEVADALVTAAGLLG